MLAGLIISFAGWCVGVILLAAFTWHRDHFGRELFRVVVISTAWGTAAGCAAVAVAQGIILILSQP